MKHNKIIISSTDIDPKTIELSTSSAVSYHSIIKNEPINLKQSAETATRSMRTVTYGNVEELNDPKYIPMVRFCRETDSGYQQYVIIQNTVWKVMNLPISSIVIGMSTIDKNKLYKTFTDKNNDG